MPENVKCWMYKLEQEDKCKVENEIAFGKGAHCHRNTILDKVMQQKNKTLSTPPETQVNPI